MLDSLSSNKMSGEAVALAQIASGKKPILNHPGAVLLSDLYYSPANSTVDATEQLKASGKDIISLSGRNIGGSASATINNDKLYGMFILELALPAITVNDIYLPRGWGLNAIRSIDYTAGSSNQGRVILDTNGIFMALMMSAKTSEARSFLLSMAGEQVDSLQVAGTVNRAFVPLMLPWSTWDDEKLPIDLNLSRQPFTLNIEFAQKERFMAGIGVVTYANTTFSQAQIVPVTTTLEGPAKASWVSLLKAPSAIVSYPSTHKISHSLQFTGDDTNPIPLTLTGLIDGDVVNLAFMIVRNDQAINNALGTAKLAPFNAQPMSDFTLSKDGTNLFRCNGIGAKIFNAHDEYGSGEYIHSMRTDAVASGPFFTFPQSSNVLYWSSVQGRGLFERKFQNGPRYAQQTITLSFTTPLGTTGVPFTLTWMASYNQLFSFNEGRTIVMT